LYDFGKLRLTTGAPKFALEDKNQYETRNCKSRWMPGAVVVVRAWATATSNNCAAGQC